tara:strand:+ start:175 stop:402 length:228 start_codon:yes stop_codon:yes gene_type:complete
MIKDDLHIITQIEIFLQKNDYEFQSIGNEFKIYLDESEIYIVVDKCISIYDYESDKPYLFYNVDDAIIKLKSIIS